MLIDLSQAEISGILQMAEVVSVRGIENIRQLLVLTEKLKMALATNGTDGKTLEAHPTQTQAE